MHKDFGAGKTCIDVIGCRMPMDPADAQRRWFGLFFLILAGGMLIWGQTVLRAHLEGAGFVIYWLACMGFTALAMVMALLDIRAVRRRTRDQQRDLLQHIFEEGEPGRENEGDKPDRNVGS
jgi:hypothetical protein